MQYFSFAKCHRVRAQVFDFLGEVKKLFRSRKSRAKPGVFICNRHLFGKELPAVLPTRYFIPKKCPMESSNKPPNVLVYTGESKENLFKEIAKNLLRCLHPDKYVVYELKRSQVLEDPWKENVALLVVFCPLIDDSTADAFRDYLDKEGKILIFCSNFSAPKLGLKCDITNNGGLIKAKVKNAVFGSVYHGMFSYSSANGEAIVTDTSDKPVVVKAVSKKSIAIASAINLVSDSSSVLPTNAEELRQTEDKHLEILKTILDSELGLEVYSLVQPTPTSGYVIVEDRGTLSEVEEKINMKEISIGEIRDELSTQLKVPLVFEDQTSSSILFDKAAYYSKLGSNRFGRVVVYFPVITSTMIPIQHLTHHGNMVVIASRQISGRGRGGNAWISPEGCAAFTLHFSLQLSSRLGQRLSVLQHMASLSVTHGICKIPEYQHLDLRVKWPNDIYLGNQTKIGGVLVTSTIQGDTVQIYVGIGVNVSNQRPTICINSAIEAQNASTGSALQLLKIEEVIASTLTELESIVDNFQKLGPDVFLSLYYKYWLHDKAQVSLSTLKEEGTIDSIDDYGFLVVKTKDGRRLTLQPDGNRFDIMKNLIIAKE